MIRNTTLILSVLALLLGFSAPVAAGPAVGEMAPDFRLQDQKGDWHDLEQYRGRWVTLYFYPKDDTPGCTAEACAFRDNIFAFEDMGAAVLGVSLDDVKSHGQFAEKYSLPFSLLADLDGATAKAYGVLSDFGGFKVAKRETFLIDPEGRVAHHYPRVNPAIHSEEVLAELKKLMAGGSS